ncbi:MAG TPA: zf-HC2 domain-containing protein [Thermoanaerobaculia bacterium]|nr:zf-HC2 domain-containing protein [Thermoanaerobaculia bacterium]
MTKTLEEWLRDAYTGEEAGCPPPEAFLEAEAGDLSPEESRALEEHADRCPACAAERELARLFDAAPEEAGVRSEDVGFVVSRLEEASPVRRAEPAPRVVPFPGPRCRNLQPLFRFAAAAVLILAAGLAFFTLNAPEPSLPAPEEGVVRGTGVEALAPVGEVEEIPAELRWTPQEGARTYRVRLLAVDDTVLWDETVTAPPARLPGEVAGRLHRAVVYRWTVEALDASGARLATSGPVEFRVRPGL